MSAAGTRVSAAARSSVHAEARRSSSPDAGRVRREKRAVGAAVLEEPPDDRESERADPCPGAERDEGRRAPPGGSAADRRPRDGPRASAPPGCTAARWMPETEGLMPQSDDQLRRRVVGIGDAGHLPVEAAVGGGRGSGANGPGQARRAQPVEEPGVGRVLRKVAVRAAVREREDAFPAAPVAHGLEPGGDEVECFVPRRALELPLALAPRADPGMEDARRPRTCAGDMPRTLAQM